MTTREPQFDISNIPEWTQAQIVALDQDTWLDSVLYDGLSPEVTQVHQNYSKILTAIFGRTQHPWTWEIDEWTAYELKITGPDAQTAKEHMRIH